MIQTGINRVWNEDGEFQNIMLRAILEEVRGVNEEMIEKCLEYFRKEGFFYVPTDSYMIKYFGDVITDYSYDLFIQGQCKLTYRLAMPIKLMNDDVIGFIGYNNKDDEDPDNPSFIKYLYPSKRILEKSRYMFCTREEFKLAMKEDYICIVDGLFDQKLLNIIGIPAVSLCGSALTEFHKLYLREIKHKIIVADNDLAGRKMVYACKKVWPTCVEIRQSETNDIDGYLSILGSGKLLETINLMKKEGFSLTQIITKERSYNHGEG